MSVPAVKTPYVRVPVTLVDAVARILHALAVDQLRDGQFRNGSITEDLAHRLDRIIGKGDHQ